MKRNTLSTKKVLDQQNEIGQENGSERMRNDAC